MNNLIKKSAHIFIFLFFPMLYLNPLYAGNAGDKDDGIIKGRIIDNETKSPVEDAVVKLLGTEKRIASDSKGEFIFNNLDYTTYRVEVSSIGYKPVTKSDLVITSGKPLDIVIELVPSVIMTKEIEVEANYFQKNSDENTSVTNFDYEEVRRAPGASEDIMRMLQTAPGVSIGNDQRNDLIVRGGSPFENLLMIDGIEIPNISHFGSQSTTSGAITFVNLKFIRDTKIYTGGFPVKFGDRLSSVVDIKFRNGSKTNYYNNFELSMIGFGGMFEGPLTKKASYLLSVRRSYLDLMKDAIRLSAVPNYWDFNLKLNYDIDDNNRLSLIGFSALDKINFKSEDANTVDDPPFNSDVDTKVFTLGANYQHTFGNGYVQAVVSNSNSDYNVDVFNKDFTERQVKNNSNENETTAKVDVNYKLNKMFYVNFGTGTKYGVYKNNVYLKADTTAEGYEIPELNVDGTIHTNKVFANIGITGKFFGDKLVVNAGGRYDYFDYINSKSTFSPRFGISYSLTPVTTLNASYGIFHQTPASVWLASSEKNRNLNSIRCDHYIAGIEHFFSSEIKASVEVYEKRYKDYPVSVDQPTFILIDGGSDFGPNIFGEYTSVGKGYVSGVDFSLEKKLSGNGIYGMINYSYSKSGFTALAGDEKPGAFDPTHQLTLIAGYQVADDWLIGLKFKYAGGRPYTPFDIEKSLAMGRGVYDMSKFNSMEFPAYHRLDLRVDKKFYIGRTCLTTYLELQNVYNRNNVYGYFWNEDKNAVGTIYHWSFMPVGGFSYQF